MKRRSLIKKMTLGIIAAPLVAENFLYGDNSPIEVAKPTIDDSHVSIDTPEKLYDAARVAEHDSGLYHDFNPRALQGAYDLEKWDRFSKKSKSERYSIIAECLEQGQRGLV